MVVSSEFHLYLPYLTNKQPEGFVLHRQFHSLHGGATLWKRFQHRFARMGHKFETGCGIREILRTDMGWKYLGAIGMRSFQLVGCGIVLKIRYWRADAGFKQQMTFWIRIIKILKVAGWRDEAKTSGGMRDLKCLFLTLLEQSSKWSKNI